MIRVRPNLAGIGEDPTKIHDRILAAVLRVPAFESGALPVNVVIERWTMDLLLRHLRYPPDPDPNRNLMRFMLDTYAQLGLIGFVSDGEDDDEDREAEADRALITVLRSHPDAIMRDGSKRGPR